MEIKNLLNDYKIIGVIGSYKHTLNLNNKVKDLKIDNLNNALKMVNLDLSIINSKLEDLTISELWKIDLATKLDNDIIIIGNLYNSLIYKEREIMKKLFIKLSNNYNKKIVIIDNNVNSFFNLVNMIFVVDDKDIVYKTDDFYDMNLYKYINIPNIVEFINYVNKNKKILNNTIDIYELIKDIYRSVS